MYPLASTPYLSGANDYLERDQLKVQFVSKEIMFCAQSKATNTLKLIPFAAKCLDFL